MTVDIDNEMISGERVGAHVVPIRSYAAGRVCATPGCGTRLSMYNSSDRCAAHDFRVEALRGLPRDHEADRARRHGGVRKVA